MHERSLVRALLRQVERVMERQHAARVCAIRVSLGEFGGVETDLFVRAFEELVEDSAARGAELIVERVPLEASCDRCGREFAVDRFRFECPDCRSRSTTIVRGEELLLESVTLERVEV